MNNPKCINDKTELRHLPARQMHQLIELLDIKDNWKTLAAVIKNPDCPNELLFKATDISILEEQRKRPGGSSSNALLLHWSTYGRCRHTLADAMYFLEICGLVRAADIIKNYIKTIGLNVNNVTIEKSDVHNWNDLPQYCSRINESNLTVKPSAPNESLMSFGCSTSIDQTSNYLEENILLQFSYKNLQLATDNFTQINISNGGSKLGEGAFGEVFRCATALLNHDRISHSKFVAVKRFKQIPINECMNSKEEFLSEMNLMSNFRHPNLVKLYGHSDDGPFFCIVTEYLENGSLYNYLFGPVRRPLNFKQRLRIFLDIVDAIVYLHTYVTTDPNGGHINKPYIHRDIKSANILLDNHLRARLGDLGLVRQGSTSNVETTMVTTTIKGTTVYMAPEAFRGDVSVKVDTFSFGVVSLELWTGMTAFDENREESDMVSYIDEILGDDFDNLNNIDYSNLILFIENAYERLNKNRLNMILDKHCTDWNLELAPKLIILAKRCIEQRKRNRPTMMEVNIYSIKLNN